MAETVAMLVDEGPAPGINGVINASVIDLTAEGFRERVAYVVAQERGRQLTSSMKRAQPGMALQPNTEKEARHYPMNVELDNIGRGARKSLGCHSRPLLSPRFLDLEINEC